MSMEYTYSVNNYVSMTRNDIIRQCRNIDQVAYVLFEPTIRGKVGLEGLQRCISILNEVKFANRVYTEGHDSPVQIWCPDLCV